MRNSDDYVATMIAAGPGVLACTALYIVKTGNFCSGLLLGYPIALLGSFPALPVLGLCLASAHPRVRAFSNSRKRRAWWAASLLAPIWHIGVFDLSHRFWTGDSPIVWTIVVQYATCLWIATTACWLYAVRPTSKAAHRWQAPRTLRVHSD